MFVFNDRYPSGEKNRSILLFFMNLETEYSNHIYHKNGCLLWGDKITGLTLSPNINSSEKGLSNRK